MNKHLALIPALLAMVPLLAGCPSKPVAEKEPEPITDTRAGADTAALAGRGGLPADFNDPSSPLYQRVIYFEYDRSDILPQFVDVLRAHSKFLATNPGRQMTLEGHTDERGTREYNLALGDQRTETVRRFMLAEGVGGGQINTLSYGEERPADPGHSDAAWALNRRVELVY